MSLVPRGSRAGRGLSTAAHGCSPPCVCPGIPQKLGFLWSAPKAALRHLKAGFEAHQVLSAFPRCRGASEQRGWRRAHTVFPALPTGSSGLFPPRGCSPWDHTMHRVEAAELEQLRMRERDNLGIPRAVPQCPASPSPCAGLVSPSQGSLSSACWDNVWGQALGSAHPSLQGEPFFPGNDSLCTSFPH